MFNFLDFLDNREKAFTLWVVAFFVFAVWKAHAWGSLAGVVTSFAAPKVSGVFVAAAAYTAVVVLGLHEVGLWHSWATKDTILWFIGIGAVMLFTWPEASRDPDFFRKSLARVFAFSAALTFLANLYVFPLWVELLVVPVVLCVAVINGATQAMEASDPTNQGIRILRTASQFVLGFVGVSLLLYAVAATVADPGDLYSQRTLEEIGLPLLLTVAFVPYVYAVALLGGYELLFTRLRFLIRDRPETARFAKRAILRTCRLSLKAAPLLPRVGERPCGCRDPRGRERSLGRVCSFAARDL